LHRGYNGIFFGEFETRSLVTIETLNFKLWTLNFP
jgi:hypothetical protein